MFRIMKSREGTTPTLLHALDTDEPEEAEAFFDTLHCDPPPACFETKDGVLCAGRLPNGDIAWVEF